MKNAALVLVLFASTFARGQSISNSANPAAPATSPTTPVATLDTIVVTGSLDTQRDEIAPDLGATSYTITPSQIQTQSQGDNASFNQTLLRAPGVAEDSFGQLHVRGEHANLQYRINDVLIPEGLTGFGQELDTRFLDNVSLITGALPAQYGFHTAGIIDIHTKNGAFNPGGDFSLYGGSFDTINPSFQYGGTSGKWDYYFTGSFLENGQGIENPSQQHQPHPRRFPALQRLRLSAIRHRPDQPLQHHPQRRRGAVPDPQQPGPDAQLHARRPVPTSSIPPT